jgi:hypothetical protein
MADSWSKTWLERLERKEEDERIYRAIKTGDWRTALMELFKEVRKVEFCKHGNITGCQPCPQCEDEIDRLGCDDEDDPGR